LVGVGEDVSEGFGTAVPGSFDGDLVTGPQGEETTMLASNPLHLLDEAVEVELLGLPLEALQIYDDTVRSVVGLGDALGHRPVAGSVPGRPVIGSSIRRHGGKTKGTRCEG
jgi:energy-converting hydrogenase Eha subunit B